MWHACSLDGLAEGVRVAGARRDAGGMKPQQRRLPALRLAEVGVSSSEVKQVAYVGEQAHGATSRWPGGRYDQRGSIILLRRRREECGNVAVEIVCAGCRQRGQ